MQLRLRPQSEEDDFTKGNGLFALQVRTAPHNPFVCTTYFSWFQAR